MTTTDLQTGRDATRRDATRAGLVGAFVIYLVLLAWTVLFKLDLPWVGGVNRVIKLVPFLPSAGQGASQPSEVLLNFVLFVPFGIYLGLLAPSWKWWRAVGVVAAASLILEATQFILAIGSSDVTDVVVNAAGGLAGLGLLAIARRRLQGRTSEVLTRICVIGTVVSLLAVGLFVASPIQFGPPASPGHRDAPGHALGTGSGDQGLSRGR